MNVNEFTLFSILNFIISDKILFIETEFYRSKAMAESENEFCFCAGVLY